MTQKPIRLLYAIAETYPTHRADIRALFGRYLPSCGIKSDLLTCAAGGERGAQWEGGETILGEQTGGAMKNRLQMLVHMVRTLLSFPKDKYDAVQIRDMPVVATLAIIIGWFRKYRVLYWMSYPIPEGQIELAKERKLGSGIMKYLYPLVSGYVGRFLLYRFVLKNVFHIFVQSEVMKKEMVEKGIAEEKLTPVPMGVDLEIVRNHHENLAEDARFKGKTILIYLGIMERARKIWILFDMLRIVRKTHPDTILVLAGDTPDVDHRNWLLAEAKRQGLDDVIIWTGWLSMAQAWSYVKAADIALSPYPRGHLLDSASPTKVAEYMALGIPVVANDQPDQAYTLSASGAGVSVEYSGENFAREVIQLIEDPQARARMAKAGPEWVKVHRSYESLTPQLADVYRKLLVN